MLSDFRDHSLVELAGLVGDRQVSAEEMAMFALERIEALNSSLNAWAALDGELAIRDARALDARLSAGEPGGRLCGIPVGIKDLEDAAGFRTGYGSALHIDDPPAKRDSVLTARLRKAGCIVLGKTTTPEHGWQGDTVSPCWGVTHNPWQPGRSPGGSSGGSAAALASGMVPLATGSDGGGSIRTPAALCGLSAIKPTNGVIPFGDPHPPAAGTLPVRGPMTRRISDAAYALEVVIGADPRDPFSVPIPTSDWWELDASPPGRVIWSPSPDYKVDAEVARVCARAVEALESAGTEVLVVEQLFRRPPLEDWYTLWTVYNERLHGHLRATPEWGKLDAGRRAQMDHAHWHVRASEFARAQDAIHERNLDLCHQFERAPVLLLPTLAGQAPVSGRWGTVDSEESPYWAPFSPVFNMTRHPAGTVCAGFTDDGMPVGLQVVAERFADTTVMRTIKAIEEILEFEPCLPEQVPGTARSSSAMS